MCILQSSHGTTATSFLTIVGSMLLKKSLNVVREVGTSDLSDNAAVGNDEEMKALRPWLKTFDNAMSKRE